MTKKEIFIRRELNTRKDNGEIENYSLNIEHFETIVLIEVNGRTYKLHQEEVEYMYKQGLEDLKNCLHDDYNLSGNDVDNILNNIFN